MSAAVVEAPRYYGLRVPVRLRDDPRGVLSEAIGREACGELPPRSDLDAMVARTKTSHLGSAEWEEHVLIRDGAGWQLLPVWCADHDRPGFRHDAQGDYGHAWGYGGHGPVDTALSLAIGAGQLDPCAAVQQELAWPLEDLVQVLRRIAHHEEWAFTRGDILRAWRGLDGYDWRTG